MLRSVFVVKKMPPLLSLEPSSFITGGGYDVRNRKKFELKSFFYENSELCSLYSSALIKALKDWNPIYSELIKANCEGSHVAFFLKKGVTMMEADVKKLKHNLYLVLSLTLLYLVLALDPLYLVLVYFVVDMGLSACRNEVTWTQYLKSIGVGDITDELADGESASLMCPSVVEEKPKRTSKLCKFHYPKKHVDKTVTLDSLPIGSTASLMSASVGSLTRSVLKGFLLCHLVRPWLK